MNFISSCNRDTLSSPRRWLSVQHTTSTEQTTTRLNSQTLDTNVKQYQNLYLYPDIGPFTTSNQKHCQGLRAYHVLLSNKVATCSPSTSYYIYHPALYLFSCFSAKISLTRILYTFYKLFQQQSTSEKLQPSRACWYCQNSFFILILLRAVPPHHAFCHTTALRLYLL